MGTCVITGASSGIGRACALLLSNKGYFGSYALLGRSTGELSATADSMKRSNADLVIKTYGIDLAETDRIGGVMESVCSDFPDISCLCNIAGYTDPRPLLATTLESFELTYRINVYAPFLLIRECARVMRRRGGKIINVASTAGMGARPGWLSYASSKAALISMSQTLTEELAEYGIKVYCVSPGRCATKLRKRLAPEEDPATIMQPEETAKVICSLISPEESCLDGQNIVIRKQMVR